MDEYPEQPSTSQEYEAADDDENSDEDYMEIFDADKFVRDGNDIRFQLPSTNAALTLGKTMEDVHKRATIRRRNTTRAAIIRKKSSKGPPVDRSSKPKIYRQPSSEYDDVDGAAAESENLVSGEERLMELQNIRSLTLPMGQKRDYREQVKNQAFLQPSGLTLARYTAMKHHQHKKWLKIRSNMNEISHYADIWRGTLKEIEGQFGSGIMEYFKLVKWMIFLNLLLCVPMLFIIVPQLVFSPSQFQQKFATDRYSNQAQLHQNATTGASPLVSPMISTTPLTQPSDGVGSQAERLKQLNSIVHDYDLALNCTLRYEESTSAPRLWYIHILDFVQGTGKFEKTVLFYGYYFNKTSGIYGDLNYPWYNMSVAYLLSTFMFLIISLVFIVVSTSSGLENNVLADQMVYYKNINQVFAGWDFGLYKQKSARIKKSLIRLEIMRDLAEKKRSEKYRNRTTGRRCFLYFIRLLVNIIILFVLVGCAAAVYYTQTKADEELGKSYRKQKQQIQLTPLEAFTDLVWQYLPSVLITVMYAVFPNIFKKLATLESYYPATEQNITIARIVLLRLGTVFLLLLPIYVKVIACENSEEKDHCDACGNFYCWETYIGQQVYKLVLLDFFVIVGVVFFVEFPRKAIWKKYHRRSTLINWIGQEEFDIPVNVMDMVYTQTLCWVGAFYSPLLPFISFFKVIVFFFVRRLSLFHNQRPASAPYRASSMNLFFKCVLTLAFFLAVLAVGISIGVISPSRSCGPFRTHSTINQIRSGSADEQYTMFGAIAEAMLLLPDVPRDIISFLASEPFLAALIITLVLLIYVYAARATGQIRLVELLRETLKREEKDKHWLLKKVNSSLKRELSSKSR